MPAVTGYSQQDVVNMVRIRLNEPLLPVQNIMLAANRGLEQAAHLLSAIKQYAAIPINPGPNAALVNAAAGLPGDINWVESVSFSTPAGNLYAPGVIVYPVLPRTQERFYDITGGAPAVGSGAPMEYYIQSDVAGQQTWILYPVPTVAGQLNIFYWKRAQAWDQTNTLNPGSTTDIDSDVQELAVLWACMVMSESVEQTKDKAMYYYGLWKDFFLLFKERIKFRTKPKQTQVKEIGETYGAIPGWAKWGSG